MNGWSKQLGTWMSKQRRAEETKLPAAEEWKPALSPILNPVLNSKSVDVEMWLEQRATELNGDWSLARLSGFSRGEDAAARQAAVAALNVTEELWVEPALEDLYSSTALRVRTLEGTTIGSLEPSVAETVSRQMKEGSLVRCFVYKITLNESKLPSSVLLALMSWALSPASR